MYFLLQATERKLQLESCIFLWVVGQGLGNGGTWIQSGGKLAVYRLFKGYVSS